MLAVVLATLGVAAVSAAAQTRPPAPAARPAKTWTPPKTPWGDPDLQGIYNSDDYINTPLERSAELGERLYFTETELAETAARLARQAATNTGPQGTWGERERRPPRQTSLIVDPPNGRLPALMPEGQKRLAAAKQTALTPQKRPASWEDYDYYIRCITRGLAGSILPSSYDNGTQITQAPGYVTLLHEKVHEARIIPLDKRPHLGQNVRSYLGDSRGHWEGNTLVVETTNFYDNRTGIGRNGGNGIATSDALRLTERFTPIDPNTIHYEMTIDDPKIYTSPWKIAFPLTQDPGYKLFEYTCHESNHSLYNMLSGARAEEKAEATKQDKQNKE
jgi:hypothetical protein